MCNVGIEINATGKQTNQIQFYYNLAYFGQKIILLSGLRPNLTWNVATTNTEANFTKPKCCAKKNIDCENINFGTK